MNKYIQIPLTIIIWSVCSLQAFSQEENAMLIFEHDENGAIVCEEYTSEQKAEDSMYVYQSPYKACKEDKASYFWMNENVQMKIDRNGMLTVNILHMPADANCTLNIATFSGIDMLSVNITNSFTALDTRKLSFGQYIIRLISGRDVYSKKIILGY